MHPSGVSHPRGYRPQGGLRQSADDHGHPRHAAGGKRAAAQRRVRPCGETRVRLRARLARGRSPALGQSLLLARAYGFSFERAPADAAHHGQGHRAAVLSAATRPLTATKIVSRTQHSTKLADFHRLSNTITLETKAFTSRMRVRPQSPAILPKSSLR